MTDRRGDVEPASPVRDEDSFDVGAVTEWLVGNDVVHIHGTPVVRQFAGGASNLTYLLRYPERDVVLRRPPAGRKAKGAHDMAREFRIQRGLQPVFGYVPDMVAFCADAAVIGSDFYVMERLEGTVLRAEPPAGFSLRPGDAAVLCRAMVDVLAELHAVDPTAAGLDDLSRGPGYVRRQVAGWSQRYDSARTRNVPGFAKITDWLDVNQPHDVALCLIHNDFRFDNLVLRPSPPYQVTGVLDWEMATVGDPLMDLGCALAYWVQPDDDPIMRGMRRQPTHLQGMLTRRQVVEHYCERTGRSVDGWVFYEVFGLFRLAVILQQIYFRYHHQETRNPAFRHFWLMVHYLGWRCGRAIRAGGG